MATSNTTDRGVLFKGAMVRALLSDLKTQTRRALYVETARSNTARFDKRYPMPAALPPVGRAYTLSGWVKVAAGDRLWVRETWACLDSHKRPGSRLAYRADTSDGGRVRVDAPWIPAIHMFRWASRITLEITGVRVERLQSISDDDLAAEGIQELVDAGVDHDGTARDTYRALWESINGPGSWAANPCVVAISFKRLADATPRS